MHFEGNVRTALINGRIDSLQEKHFLLRRRCTKFLLPTAVNIAVLWTSSVLHDLRVSSRTIGLIKRGIRAFNHGSILHNSEMLCSTGLLHPIGADDGGDSQGHAGSHSSQEAQPQPQQPQLEDEGEQDTNWDADEVEGAEVDASAGRGTCAAAKDSAGDGLGEVAELAEAHDGQDLGDAAEDLVVGSEGFAPD